MAPNEQFDSDTEDLACDFVKEELGRFDWRNNWMTLKVAGTALPRVETWLKALGYNHDPKQIVAYLDSLTIHAKGRWF